MVSEVLKQDHRITGYLVNYSTQRKQWKELLQSPELLNMELPKEIVKKKWDVILVDAPEGWEDSTPGRMKSIFVASQLAKNSCDVFAHDCHRQVEKVYCDLFLKQENLKTEIGLLRHYHMSNRHT
jgi:uncharacterized protein (TIGR01627 family)